MYYSLLVISIFVLGNILQAIEMINLYKLKLHNESSHAAGVYKNNYRIFIGKSDAIRRHCEELIYCLALQHCK
jgi:hypothetical protein